MVDRQTFLDRQNESMKELLGQFLETVDRYQPALEIDWKSRGFELRTKATNEQPAGRPRILVFDDEAQKLFAFFYKPSRLNFSKDRFSYGLLSLHRGKKDQTLLALDEGLSFLAGGFKPSERPAKLPRSVNVDIPRD